MGNPLEGKWALVTGASSGLGEEFARQLAARGAHLIVSARSKGRLERLATELESAHGIQTHVVTCDLGRPGGATKLCQKVDALEVPVELLVNNAGFATMGSFVRMDGAAEAEMVRLNCEAVVTLARHFLEKMSERGGGGAIHIASMAGLRPVPYSATYSATKGFILNFSLALAEEMRPHGVRVVTLSPGIVPTGFQARSGYPTAPKTDPVLVLEPREVIRQALDAYAKGGGLVVPGLMNQIGATVSRLFPADLSAKAISVLTRRTARGAEERTALS